MTGILVSILVAVICLAIVWYVTGAMGLPENVRNILMLVALLLFVLYLLGGYAV